MKRGRATEIIAAAVLAAVLIGEIMVYTSGTDDYRIDASRSGSGADYSVSVHGSQTYSVIAMDSGMENMDGIYVYCDSGLASCCLGEQGPIGSRPIDQEYYVDQLVKNLALRSSVPVTVLNAGELRAGMETDLKEAENGTEEIKKGLVIASGAFPETIYTGSPEDPIFRWLDRGGRLYWAGGTLGAFYSTANGIEPVSGGERLFLGAECVNGGDADFVSEDVAGNDLRYDLALKNNRIKYGIDTSRLPGVHLAAGYTDGTYSSIVFAGYGNGMICVLAGDLSRNQWYDLAQVLASNICHSTKIVDVRSGSVRYGTAEGWIDLGGRGDVSMYIYMGGHYPVYGRSFWLDSEA